MMYFTTSRWIMVFLAVTLLLVVGCQASKTTHGGASASVPAKDSAKPNFGPPMQDVRTEATIQAMEMDYNAARNSQPTHLYEAETEAAKKAKAKPQEAAKEADKKDPAPKQ